MNELLAHESDATWKQIAPHLDDALGVLSESDRDALMLRYFERKSAEEMAQVLGISSEAAQKRVTRAIERVRESLIQRGITPTTGGLAILVEAHAVAATPPAISENILRGTRSILRPTARTVVTSSRFRLGWSWAVAVLLMIGIGGLMWMNSGIDWNTPKSASANPATQTVPASGSLNSGSNSAAEGAQSGGISSADRTDGAVGSGTLNDGPGLLLNFVTKDAGEPVPNVTVSYRGAEGNHFTQAEFKASAKGEAKISIVPGTTYLTLQCVLEGFANTRLSWDPDKGEQVPKQRLVRLERAHRLGGKVLDPNKNPVVGARVVADRFSRGVEPDRGTMASSTTEFAYQQVQTDAEGRWEVGSVPESLLDRIRIDITHDDFAPAFIESPAMDPSVRSNLLARRHEIRLVPGAVVVGEVLNSEGRPVPDATVRVGRLHFQGTKEVRTDATGRFRIGGLTPEKTVISARAKGHGGVAESLTVSPKTPEVTLRLKKGRQFSGIVTDADHQPLADVIVYTEPGPPAGAFVEVDLARELRDLVTRTEADGSWTWEGGPDSELRFSFSKDGYSRSEAGLRPGEPATTVLEKVREVRGVVVDSETGDPVTQFHLEPRANAFWSPSDGRDVTSSEGRFVLPIYDNRYERIQVSSPAHEPVDEVIPEAVGGVIDMAFRLKKSGEWSGVVVDASGRPVPEAWVGITGKQGELELDGYRLIPLLTGSPMAVSGSGGDFKLRAIKNPIAVAAATAGGFGVTLAEEFQRHHRIRLLPYGTLQVGYHGDVDADGGVRLQLQLFKGGNAPWPGILMSGGVGRPISANGRFEFHTIPPGNHKLIRLVQKGTITEIVSLQDVVVESGQTTTVEIGAP
jgi:hypothetical protein